MDQRSKIAILGYGTEGRAMLDYLLLHEYSEVTVCDRNVELDAKMPEGVSVKLGPEYMDGLGEFDVIFRSPGVPYLTPALQDAKGHGVELTSVTDFFMDQCPCPVIGVTGTKGKGTTCTLILEMLKRGGRKEDADVFLGGNIGRPPIEFLDAVKGDDLVILEMSSFQLQGAKKSPHYAVILNTTSDHLDYHADREEYLQAKEKILHRQHPDALAVLNKDYEYSKYYKPLVNGRLKWVSVKEKADAYVKDGVIYLGEEKVCLASEMKLVGSHNIENILYAAVIAGELGVSVKHIAAVIRTFENLPHRLQLVREFKDVRYFNDSYSTTPETSMAAVDSFDEPTVLIAGGYDKGADYNEWAVKILTKPSLETVILIGDTAEKMEEAIVAAEEKLGDAEGSPTKVLRRGSLEEAVVDAYAEAREGGVVVMSPAAASFDMFKDYKERGAEFIKYVKRLK